MHRFFYDWVNPKFDIVILIFLTFCVGMSSGIPSTMSSYITYGLSTNPADISAFNYAYFAGMSIGIILVQNLNLRFTSKTIFLGLCLTSILLNYILTSTENSHFIFLVCFFIGALRMMGSLVLIIAFIPILMPRGERHKLYAIYYPLSMILTPISGYMLTYFADRFDWHFSFHFSNLLLFIACLLAIAFVKYQPLRKSLGLWKVDWIGMLLASVWMLSLVYIGVYGRYMDWFDSINICFAALLFVVCLVLLLLKNGVFSKPLFEYKIFRMRNIKYGMIFMFFFAIFFSNSSSINTLLQIALHNDPVESALVNLTPVVGYIVGAALTYLYFNKLSGFKPMLLLSILLFTLSSILIYQNVDLNMPESILVWVLIFRGMGMVICYITIGLYVTTGVHPKYLSKIPIVLIFVRSYLGPIIWASIFSNCIYRLQIQFLNKLASWSESDSVNPLFIERFGKNASATNSYSLYQQQAQLSSIKTFTGWMILFGFAFMVFFVFYTFHKRDDKRIFNWTRWKNVDSAATAVTG